jgi:hypothetical protein
VRAECRIEPERAEQITRQVVATLRSVAPPDVEDVSAVLPGELCELWETSRRAEVDC